MFSLKVDFCVSGEEDAVGMLYKTIVYVVLKELRRSSPVHSEVSISEE